MLKVYRTPAPWCCTAHSGACNSLTEDSGSLQTRCRKTQQHVSYFVSSARDFSTSSHHPPPSNLSNLNPLKMLFDVVGFPERHRTHTWPKQFFGWIPKRHHFAFYWTCNTCLPLLFLLTATLLTINGAMQFDASSSPLAFDAGPTQEQEQEQRQHQQCQSFFWANADLVYSNILPGVLGLMGFLFGSFVTLSFYDVPTFFEVVAQMWTVWINYVVLCRTVPSAILECMPPLRDEEDEMLNQFVLCFIVVCCVITDLVFLCCLRCGSFSSRSHPLIHKF